jgi:hypothetical protein
MQTRLNTCGLMVSVFVQPGRYMYDERVKTIGTCTCIAVVVVVYIDRDML